MNYLADTELTGSRLLRIGWSLVWRPRYSEGCSA